MEKAGKEKQVPHDAKAANQFIDTMTLVNKSYVYEFASEAYCRDHGRKRKDVVGYSVAHVFGEANFRKFIKKHLDQCFSGNVVRYENWLDIPGEEARFYRVSYSPYFNAEGQITHAVVSSVDITSIKREEESLEKSHSAFRKILENMHYGLFTFDTEGKFTFVNDVIVKRSGYPREWYIGKNLFDVVRPQEKERVKEHFQATVRGEPVAPYEFGFKKAAGEIAWAHISTTPVRDGGRIVGVLGVMLDITKRVESEHKLAESEKKYRTLFEDSRDAIFITDDTGLLTDVNPSFLKLFGYTKEEAGKLRAIDTYVNREECKDYVRLINQQGFVEKFTVQLKKKDGSIMKCLLNGTPLPGPDGKILGYQGIAREIDVK
ncbi:MAG: PAS domain-containing protein [Syntrophorhabdus sp.]